MLKELSNLNSTRIPQNQETEIKNSMLMRRTQNFLQLLNKITWFLTLNVQKTNISVY